MFESSIGKSIIFTECSACLILGEGLAKLVRTGEKAKIPVMCVVGEKEAENRTLSVRTYGGEQHSDMPSSDVLERLLTAVSGHGSF